MLARGLTCVALIGAVASLAFAAAAEEKRQEQVFSVDHAGRYAIRVESKAGAALRIIDRMAGPSALAGEAGKQDGRLDLLLDRGSYKAVMTLPEHADGAPSLHVDAFRELNAPEQPRLVELKPVDSDLDDLTQRSWWIDLPKRRSIAIEAAGRHLADLRLWKDGNWLVDALPSEARVEPEPGQPLAVRRLVATLEPGLYLVTAYGGAGEVWAKESAAKPFHLRFGIPVLAEAARLRHVMSPFGVDRFLVPKPANRFYLQLDQPDAAVLTVGDYDASHPFGAGGNRGEIAKNSRSPLTEVDAAPSGDFSVVTVERQPGQPYLLQNFYSAAFYDLRDAGSNLRGGKYWIDIIDSGSSDDDADVTGVLTEITKQGERILATSAIELSQGQAWRRRFNLLDTVTLYLAMTAGHYVVNAEGDNVQAEFRFEPVGPLPDQYRVPAFERGDHVWTLDNGIYRLTIEPRPEKKGIATVTVKPTSFTGDIAPAKRLGTVAWREQPLSEHGTYRLYVNEVPGIDHGLVLRALPIDLARDLPVTLAPGEQLDLPLRIPENGLLLAEADDGSPVAYGLDGQGPDIRQSAASGEHRIAVANQGKARLSLSLHLERDELRPDTPLPALSAEHLKELPNFPPLAPEKPVFLDLAHKEQRSFNIAVGAPALYRIETGGLLHTEGNLRTRMVTSLARANANGVGRNFLIQRYLREGDYQLSLAPQGASAGHLSLTMAATPIEDRGLLALGIPSRATLQPSRALRYDFRIEHPGHYRLHAFGMNRDLALRVEDADGWPIAEPIVQGKLEQDLTPGLYHATLLPNAIAARSLTLLDEVLPPAEYVGHGPHAIGLGEHVTHEWREPEKDGERIPDQWRFALPAAADIAVSFGEGMIATLLRETGGQNEEVARLIRSPGWHGSLAGGNYRLEMASIRPNNHLSYDLSIESEELLVGQSRSVKAPAAVPISLDGNDLVELSSFGNRDVRARLYDDRNGLVAANDDRADDWNFDIAATLPPGRYRLQVDPVGANAAETRVDLTRPEEKAEPALAVGANAHIDDAALHTFPLEAPREASLLVLAAQSADAVSLSLERLVEGGLWRGVAGSSGKSPLIAIPVAADSGIYRLRAWSTDRKATTIEVASRSFSETPASENALGRGLTLRRMGDIEPPVWAGAMAAARPGILHIESDSETLRWTSARGVAAASDASGLIVAGGEPVWLVARGGATAPQLHGSRVDFGEETRLVLPPGEALIAPAPETARGPLLWVAQSRFGQPGIVLGETVAAPATMGVAANAGVAVAMPGTSAGLRLWNAEDRTSPLPLTLRRIALPAPETERFAAGERSLSLPPRSAHLLALGSGRVKRLHLALAPDTVALLRQADNTLATLWPERDSRDYTAELAADSILLLNAGDSEARATLAWTEAASDGGTLTLAAGRIFKRYESAAGTLLLDIPAAPPSSGARLRIAGNAALGTLVGGDGSILRGNDLPALGPARLLIDHGPGLVAAWIDDGAAVESAAAVALEGTARIVRLRGPVMRFAATPAQPVLLSVRTTAPVIATIIAPDGRATTEIFADGGRISRYLPSGRTVVALQSAADGDLVGDAEFIERPIAPIDEGLGEAVRLAAGDARVYSFTLSQDQTIGIGLRASVDIARCELLDSAGKTLGSGIVQMHKLDPGTYLLAVEMPPDAAPVEIRPALVGLRQPEPTPPDDIKRHYLQLVGRLPSE
jgi:hypothetical protein